MSAQVDLLPSLAAPRAARRVVDAVLTGWALPVPAVQDAVLLVSELVTNAVRHAQEEASLQLEVTFGSEWLRISLADGSAVRPLAREAAWTEETGRGMSIVTALSERWGIEDYRGGKRIWFDAAVAPVRDPADRDPADRDPAAR